MRPSTSMSPASKSGWSMRGTSCVFTWITLGTFHLYEVLNGRHPDQAWSLSEALDLQWANSLQASDQEKLFALQPWVGYDSGSNSCKGLQFSMLRHPSFRPNPNGKELSGSGSSVDRRLEGSEVGTRNVHCSISSEVTYKKIYMLYMSYICHIYVFPCEPII